MSSPSTGTNGHNSVQAQPYKPLNNFNHGNRQQSAQIMNQFGTTDSNLRYDRGRISEHHRDLTQNGVYQEGNCYSWSQESGSDTKTPPIRSPSFDLNDRQTKVSKKSPNYVSNGSSTQTELEKLDDLLKDLTPRLNDSTINFHHRPRQSSFNSKKPTSFEQRIRYNSFNQSSSPTNIVTDRDYRSNEHVDDQERIIASSYLGRAPATERVVDYRKSEEPRIYNNWHSDEKKKLQKTRSLLDEKDKYLTDQLRRFQNRSKATEASDLSHPGYNSASSQQLMDGTYSDRFTSYPNKDPNPPSEWEESRMFSNRCLRNLTRRASSEVDYPQKVICHGRRNTSPVVAVGQIRRPLIRRYSNKEEFNYPRELQDSNGSASSRVNSPNTCHYTNGLPSQSPSQLEYDRDIPQVRRRNIKNLVQPSGPVSTNLHQPEASTTKDRSGGNVQAFSSGNTRGILLATQENMRNVHNSVLSDEDKGRDASNQGNRTGNSGFQIRMDNESLGSGISYYNPDDASRSSDGYPLASKLSATNSPSEQLLNSNSTNPYNRPLYNDPNMREEQQNPAVSEYLLWKRNYNSDQSELESAVGTQRKSHWLKASKNSSANSSNNSSIRKSAKIWYQPHMSREDVSQYLEGKPPGTFIVRQSHTFNNSYGLALKVSSNDPGEDNEKCIRHFLIESNSKGVRIRGCANEPYFGSLTALVHQHTLTKLALPCCLNFPNSGLESDNDYPQVTFEINYNSQPTKHPVVFTPRTFMALYLGSVETDYLTGIAAISKSVEILLENRAKVKQTEVSIRVSPDGVTLTDVHRKLFFRRHYPVTSISYCGVDNNSVWESSETRTRGVHKARILGFVARNTTSTENMCHMLCECSVQDSARAIANFIADCVIPC